DAAVSTRITRASACPASLPPTAKALGQLGEVAAHVGPGPVTSSMQRNGYDLQFHVTPNRAAQDNRFALTIKRNGRPVTGAGVTAKFAMLDMEMGQQEYALEETD